MGIQINGQTDTVASTTSGGSVTLTSATLPAVSNISATRVNVSGVSTFTSGPVLIGSGTSTGTASQTLQVTGGVYASGNLGIGTINPQERVHFYSPTSTNFIRLDNSSSATSYYGLNSSGDVELNAATNNNLIFKTFGTERGRFNSSGNLGIGTVTPSSLLHLLQSSGNAKITIQRSNTGSNTDDYGSILWRSSAANNNGAIGVARESGEDNGYMYFSTGSGGSLTERLRISSSGNTYNFTNPQFVSYSGSFGGNLGIVAPFTKTVFVNASTTTTIATIDMSSNYTAIWGGTTTIIFTDNSSPWGVYTWTYQFWGRVAQNSGSFTAGSSLIASGGDLDAASSAPTTPVITFTTSHTTGVTDAKIFVRIQTGGSHSGNVGIIIQGFGQYINVF